MVIILGALGGVVVGGFAVAAWYDLRARRRGHRIRVTPETRIDPATPNSPISGFNQTP
jgi:hypothetical protein